jgi:hypothetical protein
MERSLLLNSEGPLTHHARLTVNSAHTLRVLILEAWQARKLGGKLELMPPTAYRRWFLHSEISVVHRLLTNRP